MSEEAIFNNLKEEHPIEELVKFDETNIQEKLQENVFILSLPHGSLHPSLLEIAKKIGYRYICTSDIDYYNVGKNDVGLIPRIPVLAKFNHNAFIKIVNIDNNFVKTLIIKKKCKNLMKSIIGIDNYRKMYRLFFRIHLTD